MRKNQILLLILALSLAGSGFWFLKNTKTQKLSNRFDIKQEINENEQAGKITAPVLSSSVVILEGEKSQKIDLANGNFQQASDFEILDFSGWEGFPKLGVSGNEYLQQGQILKSKMLDNFIVQILRYNADGKNIDSKNSEDVIGREEYVCNVFNQKCEKSDILSQNFDGLDADIQNNNDFSWLVWNHEKNKLIGALDRKANEKNTVTIFSCEIERRNCQKFAVGNSSDSVNIPLKSVAPSFDKFVVVSHNDKVGSEKKWEILQYSIGDLVSLAKKYDISTIVSDKDVDINKVESVAWNFDENKLAIGVTREVFLLNMDKESLSLVYKAPSEGDEEYDWDYTQLFLSPDAKFVALVDSTEIIDDEQSADLQEPTFNNLKKIDLESKTVSILYSGSGLEMQL